MAIAATVAELKPDRVRIMIPISNEPGGKEDVVGAVNGESFVIKRGKPVNIKRCDYEALMNAVVVRHYKDDEGVAQTENVPRYNISLLGG